MKTEIPFIMKGTIDWINKRTKEKKNDKKFMERFQNFKKKENEN